MRECTFFRLLDCLAGDFPSVHAVVGHERFHALVRDYLERHPSTSRSVRSLGRFLAQFLEAHPLGARASIRGRSGALRVGLARGVRRSRRRAARTRTSEERADRIVGPACGSADAVASHRRGARARPGGVGGRDRRPSPASVEPRRTVIRVWREELRVFHRVIGDVELAALRAIERGAGFRGGVRGGECIHRRGGSGTRSGAAARAVARGSAPRRSRHFPLALTRVRGPRYAATVRRRFAPLQRGAYALRVVASSSSRSSTIGKSWSTAKPMIP